MTVKPRNLVDSKDCWNVEALYPSFQTWQNAFTETIGENPHPSWPDIDAFKGRLAESPQTLKSLLDLLFKHEEKLSKLYTYAHLRNDEDIAHDPHKAGYNKIAGVMHDFNQATAWIEPELLSQNVEKLHTLLHSPILASYKFFLEKILRKKEHTLSSEAEALCAMAAKAMQTPYKAFHALNDADFDFGAVADSQGEQKPLTHGTYGIYLREHDPLLRKNAFNQLHGQYLKYENSLSELLQGAVQSHLFHAHSHRYATCLDAALFPKNIDTQVYKALIQAVNEELPSLHRYMSLRRRILGLESLHLYDMYVPLIKEVEMKISYPEAEDLIIDSVAPLGAEYQNLLRKGLKEERWVDRYENKNKRSGAYSSGCYGSMPYILMNYRGLLNDAFTLAHEAGHSMHSLLSRTSQPYHYSDYPIFLAEVASTFNEDLLTRLLFERAKTKEEKIYLINQKIEDIRSTLFRQTMFAEFELFIHERAENNEPLTPATMKQAYRKLNEKYFGSETVIHTEAEIEWARIPHFYYNFYVFQYATGISAALALADKVVTEGKPAREAYLQFLKGGSSGYPIEMLQAAGVDMQTPKPVKSAIHKFDEYVKLLEQLLFS
ncbi:oligoendopeptidase F [Parachlamydia sp. AcF125]|uniref:oligoendopeptidase F n=1 Tax=Parachlamydia sp. AcF125 TaxID=2795736 RepID=UPI001BC95B13|nr:oligoendopeptidase F [Parachlamydia sp. AcF125]MBS4168528.1 Oligoendopeptidase F, plasmid [Parachlamydia sp. AcF125]